MDPLAALAGTTQISSYCQECNSIILQCVNQVKTVDGAVTLFKESIQALQLTYDNLASGLKDTILVVAARDTNHYAGGNLWGQVSAILSDCQTTVLYIRQSLQYLQQSSKKVGVVLKNFADSLNHGELFVVKDTIKLLEQNLACCKAMVNITLQIRQPNLNETARQYITRDLEELASDVNYFCSKLTSVAQSSRSADGRTYQHLEEFNSVANNFLTSVGVSLMNETQSSAISNGNGISHLPNEHTNILTESNTGIVTGAEEDIDNSAMTYRSLSSPNRELMSNAGDADSDNDNEIELELISEYMANGQADMEMEDFASAEANFRAALKTVQSTPGGKATQFSAGEITLMMVDCYLKQDKEEDAMELLEPIANGGDNGIENDAASVIAGSVRESASPALGLQHKANHLLAVVFLKRLDFLAAEKRAKLALKGRRKVHGQASPMTLETVQLLIDIYTAKGDKVNARAYRRFLDPPTPVPKTRPTSTSSSIPSSTAPQATSTLSDQVETAAARIKPQPTTTFILPRSQLPQLLHQRQQLEQTQIPQPSQSSQPPYLTQLSLLQQVPQLPSSTSQPGAATSPLTKAVSLNAASTTPVPTVQFKPQTVTTNKPSYPTENELPGTFSPLVLSPIQTPIQIPSSVQTPSATTPIAPSQKAAKLLGLTQIAEHEDLPTTPPVETKLPLIPAPTSMEADTLSLKNSFVNPTKKSGWASFSSRLSINRSETNPRRKSETSPAEQPERPSSVTAFKQLANTQKRMMSMSNNFSFSDYIKKPDASDVRQLRASMASPSGASITTINTVRTTQQAQSTPRTRHGTASKFAAIRSLRQDGKKVAAIETAIKLLREYDPENKIMSVRETELRKNMKESHKGLAGTGYGYAPIHFFCEQLQEADFEIELLIEQGVDVNSVAYAVGMAGTDPFTPLLRAVQYGHVQIVRLLIHAGVQLASVASSGHKNAAISEPLLIACMNGHVQITYLLLVAGAAKVVKEFPLNNWHGNSLLHEAAWRGDVEMIKILLLYSKRMESENKRQKASQVSNPSLVIGTPGQQDQVGATPIMYAIDIRDCTDDKMRRLKQESRKKCLQLLLENGVDGDLQSQAYRESVAKMLSLKWTIGPGAGHSIFCYADDSGDEELMRILDPFRYQVSPGMRCSATPRCSPGTTRTSTHLTNGPAEAEGSLRTVALPMFPELMSDPIITGLPPDVKLMENMNMNLDVEESVVSYATLSPIFENGTATGSRTPPSDHTRTLSLSNFSAE